MREVNYIHPVSEKIPLGPKVCNINKPEKFYFISDKIWILACQVNVTKIPMSDVFTPHLFVIVK